MCMNWLITFGRLAMTGAQCDKTGGHVGRF